MRKLRTAILISGRGSNMMALIAQSPPGTYDIILSDGEFVQQLNGAGYIETQAEFGDCQLHIEWRTPAEVIGESQGRGNSGIFFMGQYEIQVLDKSYHLSPPWIEQGTIADLFLYLRPWPVCGC